MDELGFKKWLAEKGTNRKVQSDCVSRLKHIERELDHCDLDEQYRNDRCNFILGVFLKMGKNSNMDKFPHANFPIGKSCMSTYRYSLKKYVEFCDEANSVNTK